MLETLAIVIWTKGGRLRVLLASTFEFETRFYLNQMYNGGSFSVGLLFCYVNKTGSLWEGEIVVTQHTIA
jgi:hypothetical protein